LNRNRLSLQFVVVVILSLASSSFIAHAWSFSCARCNIRCQKKCHTPVHGDSGLNHWKSHGGVYFTSQITAWALKSSSDDFESDRPSAVEDRVVEGSNSISIDISNDVAGNNVNRTTEQRQRLVWQRLSEWFQGDFDNYAQVVEDRKQNLEPREGGGHEHFHCTLIPLTESTRLAAFYFDGNPDRIFRFRYYDLVPSATKHETVEMFLNTLHPDLEKLLKSHAKDPLSWPHIFKNFKPPIEGEQKVDILKKCEISWSIDKDPIQHSYLTSTPEDEDDYFSNSLHAIMIHGPTIVNSTIVPGMQIRIVDQLSLYQDVFYINDRGFDPITGGFIYGNQREVPYRLERISTISSRNLTSRTGDSRTSMPTSHTGTLQRQLVYPDLEWTIGPDHRTTEEYERNMKVIGGPSAGMNKKNMYKKERSDK